MLASASDTAEIVVCRALTGSSTPTASGPVVSVLTHPGYDLADDYVEPAGGDWTTEFPILARNDNKGVVNWTHGIPIGLGAVEHKSITGDTGELVLATGLTDFFQSTADLDGIDLTEYESPSSRKAIGRYTKADCLRAAADAEALVRGGYATGVSIEFRPNGPKGSAEGEGAYWDREVKSSMLPRMGRHFKSWMGLAYAHARRPVNPGCHTVINDLDTELVAKAIRVMETGKVGSHQLCERVLKAFRDDAPDLLALSRAARRSTVTVDGTPPVDNTVETKGVSDEPGLRNNVNDPKHRDLTPQAVYADYLEDHEPDHATPEVLSALRGSTPLWVSRHPETGAVVTGPKHTFADLRRIARSVPDHPAKSVVLDVMRSTNVLGEPYSGPGGVYFVGKSEKFDRSGNDYRTVRFHPGTGRTSSVEHPDMEYGEPFATPAAAHARARQLAETHPATEVKAIPANAVVEVKAKSDAWIKWKVRKLVAEGKPRKQAVAIAYSMAGRGEKEAKASPDASELVSLVRGDWFHDNGSPRTRAINSTMVNKIIEKHGVDKDTAESALKEASRYAAADWKRFKETSGEFCPKCDARLERDDDKCNSCGHEYKAYTGPLRASGKLNTNPNVEDEERGDDEPDFEIPGLDDDDNDRDTKAFRADGKDLRMSGPGGEIARTKLGAAVHNMNLAARDARIKSYAAVEDHAHPTVRYALMASRTLQRGDYERAGGAHLGAMQEHVKALRDLAANDPSRHDHLDAIKYHRDAALGVKKHLIATVSGWKPFWDRPGVGRYGGDRKYPQSDIDRAALADFRAKHGPNLLTRVKRYASGPAADTPFSHRATERTANYLKNRPGFVGRVAQAAENFGQNFGRSIVDNLRERGRNLLAKFGINKAFEDSGVSDPYEVARIASGLAMAKTGNGRQVKAVIPLGKSPREMKAFHERAADDPQLDADAADRHLRAAEMWERCDKLPAPRTGSNGRPYAPYVKARTDGFDVPAVALGPDEKPPASISALMNFAQLQLDGSEALAFDAKQSDDLMFRQYANTLAATAQQSAALFQKQAAAMQQYLTSTPATAGRMKPHPLAAVLNQGNDQNQPGTTTSGDVPPGADGSTTDDANDVLANGAQKAFPDDPADIFADPTNITVPPVTPAGPDVDEDGWLVFKAFPEWKPRRYKASELRDITPRNKSAVAATVNNTVTQPAASTLPAVEAKADEWASPEFAAKLAGITAKLQKLDQLSDAVEFQRNRRNG